MLVNFPKVRIKHYPGKGYVVETQKRTWYGRRYWIHIVSFSGLQDSPYYYSSHPSARESVKQEFMRHIYEQTDKD